ncbi:uncharacterized protein LOC132203478 isoform X2 [Neocloeon triangulifer]|uniref:uncharacterized protein LOC132203478 isoform X2 n=1 Tax=Neocloeon triangulifer TaxID=2078957 RepID=UPI00286FA9C8|nr:uncharacterized protein LOC132203478 isoform X2 [Neocloeon triangulifer]
MVWLVLGGHLAVLAEQDHQQMSTMSDALKYLHQLDKYYSQVARPSTRSDTSMTYGGDVDIFRAKQALKMLKLQELDKLYTQRSRPRFGKRTEVHLQTEERDLVFGETTE